MGKIIRNSLVIVCSVLIAVAVIYGVWIFQDVNPNPSQLQSSSLIPILAEPPLSPPANAVIVPDDYLTIQQAVTHASNGSMVFVRAGTYNETVTIDKPLWLAGENKESTVIDAHSVGPDVLICSNSVNVTGFCMLNTPTPAKGNWLVPGYEYPTQCPNIQICNASHCNIYGNSLTDSSSGVRIENSSQNNVIGNAISENGNGVKIASSADNCVARNDISGGDNGIVIDSSINNTIIDNMITDTVSAVHLDSASENTLRNNTLKSNYSYFSITGTKLSDFVNYVDASNRIDGKPIYYWINMSNTIVPSDAACIILVNCTDILIQEFDLALSSNGIVLANTNSSIVKSNKLGSVNTAAFPGYGEPGLNILLCSSFNNSVTNNRANIYLTFSSENRVTQNTGIIRLDTSNSNEIAENSITSISFVPRNHSGLVLSNSANNQIIANKVTDNSVGIALGDSSNNTIARNDVNGNSQGGIGCGDAKTRPTYNIIIGNTVTNNGNYGIRDNGYGTKIIGNNVVKNRNRGMQIGNSVDCTVIGNVIEGFLLDEDINGSPRNCSIIGNKITARTDTDQPGVWFLSDYAATLHHNNLPNVTVFRLSTQVSHKWDNGNQGNYWEDYNGTDANGDGVGDVPYVIDENNKDNYPLMAPVNIDNIMEESPEWASLATEPFPALLIIGVVMISIMIIVSVGVIYLKKRLRRTVPTSTDSSSYK